MSSQLRGGYNSVRQKKVTPSKFSGPEHAPTVEPFRDFYLKLSPENQAKYNGMSPKEQHARMIRSR